jgi:hypothetical protein
MGVELETLVFWPKHGRHIAANVIASVNASLDRKILFAAMSLGSFHAKA